MPSGPVEVMRMEHNEIRPARPDPRPGRPPGRPIRITVARLVETVRHHFDHEEQVLFRLAVKVLDAERLRELAQTWAERRGVGIGAFEPEVWAPGMRA
jgi:hemerythrin-like domain-containing protein